MNRLGKPYLLFLGAAFLLLILTPVYADHGAPPPQLGGVAFCLEPSSVQVRLEAAQPVAVVERVREKVLAVVEKMLEAENIPYDTGCAAASGYVLLGLEARFLDPETYQGFPAASYTYVTTAQVGSFVKGANPDTALPERRYTGSSSDIFQARTSEALETRLVALGQEEFGLLVRVWSEANTVAFGSYLRFAALGLALAVLRAVSVSFRGVRGRSSSPLRPK